MALVHFGPTLPLVSSAPIRGSVEASINICAQSCEKIDDCSTTTPVTTKKLGYELTFPSPEV
eukprot:6485502-Amphidinium_carterae.1